MGQNLCTGSEFQEQKKTSWDEVPHNEGIPIVTFTMKGISPLKLVQFQPLVAADFRSTNITELLWVSAEIKTDNIPNWAGFMSTHSSSKSRNLSWTKMD